MLAAHSAHQHRRCSACDRVPFSPPTRAVNNMRAGRATGKTLALFSPTSC